ncbi:MAG: hypothetical protein JOZ90_00895 [Alphaproteobacteria bacterium]|nr:hypothetical protein [Alphaproteobacteria bacterium]MBV9372342.1 hypothetical protein [Alphaproteobacteria bacterium]MBV9899634.1 hypothetical protein [Alphaproteobacteria bacterium]
MVARALLVAATVGTVLQLAMVLAGHRLPSLQAYYGPGGMLLSLLAGALYARMAAGGWGDVLLGGAVAGGLCALLGIALSHVLGDVPASLLALGSAASAAAGAAGAALVRALG